MMSLLYPQHTVIFTLVILLAGSGIEVLANDVPTGANNQVDTTRATTTTVTQDNSSHNNSVEPSTSADNQLPADNSTSSANNKSDSEAIAENSTNNTEKPSSVSTQKNVIETTQIPTRNDKTTQKSENNTDSGAQSSSKATGDIEKQSKEPGSDTTDKGLDKSTDMKPMTEETTPFMPVTFDTRWMDIFLHTHHFEGQYLFNDVRYLFDFVVRYKHPDDSRTLVTNLYDVDGAELEFNGTSSDGHIIVFTLSKMYTPGVRFPLHQQLEITGTFPRSDQPYFTGNFTKPVNSSFTWFHMNKGLGTIETGETAGTKTAIVIIIPTSIAFLGICGTVAIICWASKKGYLRGRHKSYRLFTDAQVSYESEAETIHI